jgi:uncharacterized protein YjbJ (UPF0337 family)
MPHREDAMGINKNQFKGRTTAMKGKINAVAGKILGNRRLQAKGRLQSLLGKARAAVGDAMHHMANYSKKDS